MTIVEEELIFAMKQLHLVFRLGLEPRISSPVAWPLGSTASYSKVTVIYCRIF